MKNNNQYFLLFASCTITKGAKRSLISDLQRGGIYFIPNDFYDILIDLKSKSWEDVNNELEEESRVILQEYIDDLLQKDLGFWTSNPEQFPELPEYWDSPAIITNSIIDYNEDSNFDILKTTVDLSELGCKHFQFRFYSEVKEDVLVQLNNSLNSIDRVISYEIHLPYVDYLSEKYLQSAVKKYAKIKTLLVHTSPHNKIVQVTSQVARGRMGNIYYSSRIIDSCSHCGVIDKVSATSLNNVVSYSEGKLFNSCLNRKVGIDVNGDIKNCPSMNRAFGNVDTDSIADIVRTEMFKKNWNITKDDIDICNTCEFRNVCFDCRAYTENDDLRGKPKKCNYDPILMEWIK